MKSKTLLCLTVIVLAAAIPVHARPFNTAILDGRPTEYTTDGLDADLRGWFEGVPSWGDQNVITNLFVTWDETYLYVMLQGWVENNKLVVMLDVDPGAGTGATTTTNWAGVGPDIIMWNSAGWRAADQTGTEFGMDYMFVTEGYFKNVIRITYDGTDLDAEEVEDLYVGGTGLDGGGGPVDIVVRVDDTECDLKGFEARIPWTELYTTNNRFGVVSGNNVVPTGSVIRIFAHIFNNDNNLASSSADTIPAQGPGGDYDAGLLTTDTYIEIEIDPDGLGIPKNWSGGQNPPFLRDVMGKAGGDVVYARFNKPVTTETVTNTANWTVEGQTLHSIVHPQPDIAYIFLNDSLPAAGSLVRIRAEDVEDAGGLSRETRLCLFTSETGLDEPLTVRFVLETNSGMGHSGPGNAWNATAFFINGNSPLEWGYPPSMSMPITNVLSGTLKYRDVILPPGTPLTFNYKFSALLPTGTNNYEAIRLDNYLLAMRVLTLDPDAPGGIMYVTNHLGAAAGPLRGADVELGYEDLFYYDWQRGDAGVRHNKTITFQLDLSAYDHQKFQRVMIQGTDPLRGFNVNPEGIIDWAGHSDVGWANGGLTLTHAGGGIYSVTWHLTTNGFVPGTGFNVGLVGGDSNTQPYFNETFWINDRSPRSFKYQYYVINEWGEPLGSPGYDIEVYIEPGTGTNIVFAPAAWEGINPDEPLDPGSLPDPTNAPNVYAVAWANGAIEISYANERDQRLHLVDVTDDLTAGFRHYGQRLPYLDSGVASVDMFGDDLLFARVRAARATPRQTTWWTPNPLPDTGGVVRIWFHQAERNLAGRRDVTIHSNIQLDGSRGATWIDHPMTFEGDGLWYLDLFVAPGVNDRARFVFTDSQRANWDSDYGYPNADQYRIHIGSRASWTPERVAPGGTLTITYNAAGGPLEGTNVHIHAGFDKFEGTDWTETFEGPLDHLGGELWQYELEVPTNYSKSAHFLFKSGAGTDGLIWDNYNDPMHWQAFIEPEE